jgi:hypothetical protein
MASPDVLSDVPGYRPLATADLRDPATRSELSKGALIGFFAIVESWKLSMSQAAELLDKSRSNIYKLKEYPESAFLSRDELTRISCIIGINRALHVIFPEKLAYEWMTRPNRNSLFRGETPFA